jgi:hypothetical protein
MLTTVFTNVFKPVIHPVFLEKFSPASLFANGEVGGWYDPFDLTTVFTDTAGTTPATVVDALERIDDKSGNVLNALQSTLGSRPILGRVPDGGRRNILVRTEEFQDESAWSRQSSGTTVVVNEAVAPDGTTTADRINFIASAAGRIDQLTGTGSTKAFSCWLRSVSGTTTIVLGRGATQGTVVTLTEDWQRFSHTSLNLQAGFSNGEAVAKSFYAWGAQLEEGSLSAYQKVTSTYDVTEAGKADKYYLFDDASDDSINATLPDLGANATIATATEAGVSILSGQTIGAGAYDILRGAQTFGHIVLNRPLRLSEKTAIQQYFEGRLP